MDKETGDSAGRLSAAEADAAYDRFVETNLKRNYAAHYIHGMLGMTGFRLVNTPTFVPAYIHAISGSYWYDADKNRAIAVHPRFMQTALSQVYEVKALAAELGLER